MTSALQKLISTRRVLFLSGKGGVGKTTSAAAIALREAELGRRVLLVSTDPAHNLGHLWQTQIRDSARELRPNLYALEIDPEHAADEHVRAVGEHLYGLMPEHLHGEVKRYLAVSAQSPGALEAALLERIATLVQESLQNYDLIIFDTAPSGHTSRLISLPESMMQWTDALLENRTRSDRLGESVRALGGEQVSANSGSLRAEHDQRIRAQLYRRKSLLTGLRDVLQDTETCGFILTLAAERLPVLETIELRDQLAESGVEVLAYIVNKRSPQEAGTLYAQRAQHEEHWVHHLQGSLKPGAVIAQTPLLPDEPIGEQGLSGYGTHLLGPAAQPLNSAD